MQKATAQIERAAAEIRARWERRPEAGIILGTGLGHLADEVVADAVIPYDQIPHFPRSTADSHKGQLVCGLLAGLPVVTMEGRLHIYEGLSPAATTFPVHVLARLGVKLLIVSNAAGGMNPHFRLGDIVVIDDHINLMAVDPLIGVRAETAGGYGSCADPLHAAGAFPTHGTGHDGTHGGARGSHGRDSVGPSPAAARGSPASEPAFVASRPVLKGMGAPYDLALVDRALDLARQGGFAAHRGIYVAVRGPNYETRAEYRFLRRIGGDVVGMSTVPEVIVAAHLGLRVLALSTVTNVCLPDALRPTCSEDVVAAAQKAEAHLRRIVVGILADEARER